MIDITIRRPHDKHPAGPSWHGSCPMPACSSRARCGGQPSGRSSKSAACMTWRKQEQEQGGERTWTDGCHEKKEECHEVQVGRMEERGATWATVRCIVPLPACQPCQT